MLREAPLEENRKQELSSVLHIHFKDWLYGNELSSVSSTSAIFYYTMRHIST